MTLARAATAAAQPAPAETVARLCDAAPRRSWRPSSCSCSRSLMPCQALAVNILVYGLYALGFNLLFGYLGLLSFGHAALFGAGAYGCGIAIVPFRRCPGGWRSSPARCAAPRSRRSWACSRSAPAASTSRW